jgi:hypothetical protein
MAADLSGVRAKIARADEHLALLDTEVRAFVDGDPQPYALSIPYLDMESGWYIVYGIVNHGPPLRLGVIVGDVAHNARSALDHLVWQLVLLNGATPDQNNAFPMAVSESGWNAALKQKRLRGVSEAHRGIIQSVQPYKGPNGPERTYTGMLAYLSNIDKHQVVHATLGVILDPGAGPNQAHFRVVKGSGKVIHEQVRYGSLIEQGAEMMRARVEPIGADTEVEMDGTIPIDVAFGDRRIPSAYIKHLAQVARVIVTEFESDFP